jgi:hypothetical protein
MRLAVRMNRTQKGFFIAQQERQVSYSATQ